MTHLLSGLFQKNDSKILLVVADGLGGLPGKNGQTELEEAHTPNLDKMAKEGSTGMLIPVARGITPGSGPGHFGLFGYNPLEFKVGRGVLSALGVGFNLHQDDIAARGNFCTVNDQGEITNRRAGRISSQRGKDLIQKLNAIKIEGIETIVKPVKEHRFLLVLRGKELGNKVNDTDPKKTGVTPFEARPRNDSSQKTAKAVNLFVRKARDLLADEDPANMVILRGFDRLPDFPGFEKRYGLKACALAGYPMYRGIARLLGMHTLECGPELKDETEVLKQEWNHHDFFFLHYKDTDKKGEDGDFKGKARAIEALDRVIPELQSLNPDVFIITGDHSTPSQMKSHSWHPVPVLLCSKTCRVDESSSFGERACSRGGLSQIPAAELMNLALAHSGKLRKFGA